MTDLPTVKVICHEEHIHDVGAHVFGQWAATWALVGGKCEVQPDRWVVTLIPSGRCLASVVGVLSEQDAIAVASALHREAPAVDDWRDIPGWHARLIIDIAQRTAPPRSDDDDEETHDG